MERGGPELARHLERERSHYLREMAWSRQLQRRLNDEISARLPDSLARRTSNFLNISAQRTAPLPVPSRVGSPTSLQYTSCPSRITCSAVRLRLHTVQLRPL